MTLQFPSGYCPDYVAEIASVSPRVRKVQLGDGYSQRTPVGIHKAQIAAQIGFTDTTAQIDALEQFLNDTGGATAFQLAIPSYTHDLWIYTGYAVARFGRLKKSITIDLEGVYG